MTEKELQIKTELAKAIAVELIKQKEHDSLVVDRVITITNSIFHGINPEPEDSNRSSIIDMSIEEYSFSPRVERILTSVGIKTVGDLVNLHKDDLLILNDFGTYSLLEVERFLHNNGLQFEGKQSRKWELIEKQQNNK